eukprot:s8698_g1.t1
MAEVSALEEPVVLLPSCMMQQLFLEDGDPVRVRAESLARLPALTSGLSIQVEVAIAINFQIGLRRVGVVVARLEDLSGNDVLAAKLPGHAGVLGDHEVRVELLPAADLAESEKEHEARLRAEAQRQAKIQQMLEAKHARHKVHLGDMAQSGHLDEAQSEPNSTVELCFRLPNGRQLRHRCPSDRTVSDLKRRLFGLLAASDLWKPCVDDAAALELATFSRRVLGAADMVSQIGDRAVVHVTESLEAVQAAEHSKAVLDSVVYPAGLEEAITSATHHLDPHKVVAVDQSTPTADRSAQRAPVREEGLETLPFAELRALALSLGLLAADIARAVDKAELLELITRHQRRAARHARVRIRENTERSPNVPERRASSLSARGSQPLPHPGPPGPGPGRNSRSSQSQSVGARDRRLDSATPIRQADVPRGMRGSTSSARFPRPPRGNAPGPEPRAGVAGLLLSSKVIMLFGLLWFSGGIVLGAQFSDWVKPVYEKALSKGCEVWYDKVLGKTSESNEPVRNPMCSVTWHKAHGAGVVRVHVDAHEGFLKLTAFPSWRLGEILRSGETCMRCGRSMAKGVKQSCFVRSSFGARLFALVLIGTGSLSGRYPTGVADPAIKTIEMDMNVYC